MVRTYHLHPIVDHFTIALLTFGIAAELLSAAAILLSRERAGFLLVWGQKLRCASLLLMIGGAASVSSSYITRRIILPRVWPASLGSRARRGCISTHHPTLPEA
jgi:hypothetical protein